MSRLKEESNQNSTVKMDELLSTLDNGRGGQLDVCFSVVRSVWRDGIRVQEVGVNVQHLNDINI